MILRAQQPATRREEVVGFHLTRYSVQRNRADLNGDRGIPDYGAHTVFMTQ